MAKKQDHIDLLGEAIHVEATIYCSKCDNEQPVDEMYGAEEAYRSGWRATNNHTYCPSCTKKYLKAKKKK